MRNFPKADVVLDGFSCFPKGTGVATETGYKDIESVKIGDFVLTHEGRYREVTAVMKRTVFHSTTLFAYGWDALTSTLNHPYYVKPSIEAEPRWVFAEDIKAGWYVSHLLTILPSDSISEEERKLAYLTGVLVQCSTSTLNKEREASHLVPYTDENLLTLLEEVKAVVVKSGTHLMVTHSTLSLLVDSFGESKWSRFIPEEIHRKPRAWQEAFIAGVTSHSPCCTIHSKHLAHGIARMLNNLNPDTDVSITSPAYSEWAVNVAPQGQTHHDGSYIWTPVTKVWVKPEAGSMEVFDITVDEDESFIADGFVVHNCP